MPRLVPCAPRNASASASGARHLALLGMCLTTILELSAVVLRDFTSQLLVHVVMFHTMTRQLALLAMCMTTILELPAALLRDFTSQLFLFVSPIILMAMRWSLERRLVFLYMLATRSTSGALTGLSEGLDPGVQVVLVLQDLPLNLLRTVAAGAVRELHPPEVPLELGHCLADGRVIDLVVLLFSRLSALVVGAVVLTRSGRVVVEIFVVFDSRCTGPAGETAAFSSTAAAFAFAISFLVLVLVPGLTVALVHTGLEELNVRFTDAHHSGEVARERLHGCLEIGSHVFRGVHLMLKGILDR